MNFKNQILDKIEKLKKHNLTSNYCSLYGIEKEALRVTQKGNLSVNPHSEKLGSKLTSKFITTDFSESQLELITPPKKSIEDTVNFLEHITYYISHNIGQQLLWPCSMPCTLPNEKEIPIANYGNSNQGKLKELYRIGLKYRYGKTMQMISGVHFNFSFDINFLNHFIYTIENQNNINQKNYDDLYLNVSRNYLRFGWFLTYLFGASSVVNETFLNGRSPTALYLKKDPDNFKEFKEFYAQYGTSLRMSELGYQNKKLSENFISFNSLDEYVNDLSKAISTKNEEFEKIGVKTSNDKYLQINANNLQIENEFYSPIRIKSQNNKNLSNLKNLSKSGIDYIELRNIDVNPYSKSGFEIVQGYFTEIFLYFCLLLDSPKFNENNLELFAINTNLGKITTFGRHEGLTIRYNNKEFFLTELIDEIFECLEIIANFLDKISQSSKENYINALNKFRKMHKNKNTFSERMYNDTYNKDLRKYKSFQNFALDIAHDNKIFFDNEFKNKINQSIIEEIKLDIKDSIINFKTIEDLKEASFDDFLDNFNKTQTKL